MLSAAIRSINKEFVNEATASPRLLEDMASMEKYMAESYGGRVFIELLQNADDANSSRIKLFNFKEHLIFANNGRQFNESDVIAICRSGASSKERGVTIGYRGVGFKSTSYLTSEILIYSNNTYFTFSKTICSKKLNLNENKIPTIRIPFLVESIDPSLNKVIEDLVEEGFSTVFIFTKAKIDEFIEEVKEISNGYFLFLRNILSCEISLNDHLNYFEISRSGTSKGAIITLKGKKNEQWLVVGEKETKLAFKYLDGKVVACDVEDAVYHSYLPTLDKVFCPMKINSDFSTDPSRKHLTIDGLTENAINHSSKLIFNLIKDILNKGDDETFSNILKILTERISFSKVNSLLFENIKICLNSSDWLKLNDGSINSPLNYKVLPDWLEVSEKLILRQNSSYIHNRSLQQTVYKNILNVEDFLKQFSQEEFSFEELIEVAEDESFIGKINSQTAGKIIAHIIKSSRIKESIYGKGYDLSKLIVQTNSGNTTITEIAKDSSIEIDSMQKEAINQYASRSDVEWFSEKASIKEDVLLDRIMPESRKLEVEINKNSFHKKPLISKWRSAEQQCIELEKFLGNNTVDVSKQNVGYDIESTTKDGRKRFIEVKSVKSLGMPFTLTNNEYTAAHQYGASYYICIIVQSEEKFRVLYIQNPLLELNFEKRIRQWEWYCEIYNGEELVFDI